MFSGNEIIDGAAAPVCVRIQDLVSLMNPSTWSCAYAIFDTLLFIPVNIVLFGALILHGGTAAVRNACRRGPMYCFCAALVNRAVHCNRQILGRFLGVQEAPTFSQVRIILIESSFGRPCSTQLVVDPDIFVAATILCRVVGTLPLPRSLDYASARLITTCSIILKTKHAVDE